MALRLRRRVENRVGAGETPQPVGEIGHRPGESDAKASLDMLLISPSLDLDKIREDGGDDPAVALRLLFPNEGLAEERQRAGVVAPRASDPREAAKRQGLPAWALRLLRDRERAREALRRAIQIARSDPRLPSLNEGPWKRRQETLPVGSRDGGVSEGFALFHVAGAHEHARQKTHRVGPPPDRRESLAQLRFRGRVFAAVGVARGEHRSGPARLPYVADGLGETPRAAEGCLAGAVASLDHRDPAALAFDLRSRGAVTELIRQAERTLQGADPLPGRAEAAGGIGLGSDDERARLERAVAALGRLAGRPQSDVAGAREIRGLHAHLRDIEEGARLDVETEERLRGRARGPLERPRDRGGRIHIELLAVAPRDRGDVGARALAVAAAGMDLDDELVERVIEWLAAQSALRESERAIGLPMSEQRGRPPQRIRGGGRDTRALDLEPRVERGRFVEAHPLEELAADEVVDRFFVPLTAQELAGVDDDHLGVDLDPSIALADLRRRIDGSAHLAQSPAHRAEWIVGLRPEQVRQLAPCGRAGFEEQIREERPGLVAFEAA